MKLSRTSTIRGDETASYAVKLSKPYTVGELVELILTRNEWGYIGIDDGRFSIFGNPRCEYKGDKLVTRPLPSEFLARKVVNVKASGGWSRMDFKITV